MKKNNKTCIVCSKVYTYCPTCSEYSKYPKWMSIFCSENCKNIFETASSYLANEISKEDAKAAFDGCDLSNQANFKESIQAAVEKASAESAAMPKAKKKTVTVPQTENSEKAKEQTNSEN